MRRLPGHEEFYPPVDFSEGRRSKKDRTRKDALRRKTRVKSLGVLIAKRDKITRERAQHRKRAENSSGTDAVVKRLGRESGIFTSRVLGTITDLETRDTGVLIQKIREFENAIPANATEFVNEQTAELEALMKLFYPGFTPGGEKPWRYHASSHDWSNDPYVESTHPAHFSYHYWKIFDQQREALANAIKQARELSESSDALVDDIIRNFDYGKTVKECSGNRQLLAQLIEGVDEKRSTIEGLLADFAQKTKERVLHKPTQAFAESLRRLKHLDQRWGSEHVPKDTEKLILAIRLCEEMGFDLCGEEDFERVRQEETGHTKSQFTDRFRIPRVAPEKNLGSQVARVY